MISRADFSKLKFLKPFFKNKDLPKGSLGEVAIIGRSNAGKSSLMNALGRRKNLAKVSSTPGKTQSLNYFSFKDNVYLVDLPGYGFAKVSRGMRSLWDDILPEYLLEREELKGVVVIMDMRHPVTKNDQDILMLLRENPNLKIHVVLNKADKCKKSQMGSIKKKAASEISNYVRADISVTSAYKGLGIVELQDAIIEMLAD